MRARRATALVLIGLAAGCGPAEDEPAEAPVAEAPETTPSATETPAADAWAVHPDHVGPVRFGMTIEEATAVAPGTWSPSSAISEECGHGRALDGPAGLSFMVVSGIVVRADVVDSAGARVTTAEGVGIGDTEAQVMEAYPGATQMPHKYTDGHYLVVRPAAAADSLYRIVFETDGSVVTRYRAGVEPQVQWVEGCA